MGRERIKVNIAEVEDFLRRIGSKYNIKKAIIFGSAVRGKFKEDSDIDLIIVSDEFKGKSALKRPVQLYLEWDLDYPVEFICYTTDEFEELRNRVSLVSEALKEGIVVKFG
jgi:hypothetical protein